MFEVQGELLRAEVALAPGCFPQGMCNTSGLEQYSTKQKLVGLAKKTARLLGLSGCARGLAPWALPGHTSATTCPECRGCVYTAELLCLQQNTLALYTWHGASGSAGSDLLVASHPPGPKSQTLVLCQGG